MQIVKIHIPERVESEKAFAALMRRGRVDCYPNNTYIIPEPGLKLLRDLGISFIEEERGGLDYAQKTLRDSITAPVQ